MPLPDPSGLQMRQAALYGFHGARIRFLAAAPLGNEVAGFVAASEALWWACTLDEQLRTENWYRPLREQQADGRLIQGLAYVRNRTTHALPMTLRSTDPDTEPDGSTYGVIVWRALTELPEPSEHHRQGQQEYSELIAGKQVAGTLDSVARWFAALQNDMRAGLGEPKKSTRPPWDDGRDSVP